MMALTALTMHYLRLNKKPVTAMRGGFWQPAKKLVLAMRGGVWQSAKKLVLAMVAGVWQPAKKGVGVGVLCLGVLAGCGGGGGGEGSPTSAGRGGESPTTSITAMPALGMLMGFNASMATTPPPMSSPQVMMSGGIAKFLHTPDGYSGEKAMIVIALSGDDIAGLMNDPNTLSVFDKDILTFNQGITANRSKLDSVGYPILPNRNPPPDSLGRIYWKRSATGGINGTAVYIIPEVPLVLGFDNEFADKKLQYTIFAPPPNSLPTGKHDYRGYLRLTKFIAPNNIHSVPHDFTMKVDFDKKRVTDLYTTRNDQGTITTLAIPKDYTMTMPVQTDDMFPASEIMIDMTTGAFRGNLNFKVADVPDSLGRLGAVSENSEGMIYGQFYGEGGKGVGAVFHNTPSSPSSSPPSIFGALAGVCVSDSCR